MIDVRQFSPLQIKNKRLFANRQDEILWLANTEAGRHILGIKDKKIPIVQIFPNGWKFYLGQDNKKTYFQYDFFCYEKIAKHLVPFLDYEDTIWADYTKYLRTSDWGKDKKYQRFLAYNDLFGHNFLEIPQVYLISNDYYSGAGDGYIQGPIDATWANTRDADGSSGTSVDYTGTEFFVRAGITSGTYKVRRSYFPTDTSGITDTDTIDSATLKLFGTATANLDADTTALHTVQTSQDSTSQLVGTDYNNLTFVSGGSLAAASWNTAAYNSITGDKTWVSKTGFTLIGVINSRDLNNSAPTGDNDQTGNTSEASGTANDPFLTVVSTAAADTGAPDELMTMGVGR